MLRAPRRTRLGLAAAAALAVIVGGALLVPSAAQSPAPTPGRGLTSVLFVGNNWDGTADVIDPVSLKRLVRINVVPDLDERLAEIHTDPVRLGYYLAIRQAVGEGHDQYVDDMFTSHDGQFVYVSRPSLADVVGIDLRTKKIVWRIPMEGQRADHMAISPDGSRLLVSDSTANKVHVIDPRAGRVVAAFPSGDSPHESNYTRDGKRIFHASIGMVYTPLDQPAFDTTKGDRWFQVVDARTNKVVKRIDLGEKLAEAGYEDMSSAIRPMAVTPDEKTAYFQVSFFHGVVEYDLVRDKVLRVVEFPVSEEARSTPREGYLLDSAHHGLAMQPSGARLCVAGTMSDYAAIVDRRTLKPRIAAEGEKPYWATNSVDGRYCYVSYSGDDAVGVIDYAKAREIARIPVGDHPQRMRTGVMRSDYL